MEMVGTERRRQIREGHVHSKVLLLRGSRSPCHCRSDHRQWALPARPRWSRRIRSTDSRCSW
jgi:hypothetical protein